MWFPSANKTNKADAEGPFANTIFQADLGSASVKVGSASTNIALDTGLKISEDTAEVKVLGTGVTVGRTMGVSLFGNDLKFKLW